MSLAMTTSQKEFYAMRESNNMREWYYTTSGKYFFKNIITSGAEINKLY